MSESKHYHKLKRGQYSTGTLFYKCQECPYVAVTHLVIGRPTRCWKCDNPFVFTAEDGKRVRPTCPDCRNPKSTKGLEVSGLDSIIADLMNEEDKK